jgi:hypothetical protein
MIIEGYAPRESQKPIFQSSSRFLSVDAGRRWGKTITGLNWLLEGTCNDGGINWWLAPVYSQSKMAFRKLLSAAHKGKAEDALKSLSHSELRMEFINDSIIEFKSADNPDNLRGEGLRRVVIDEAARVKKEVFEEVVRPAISDTAGRVLFISTPKGKNWFYDMWTKGQDPLIREQYQSWKFPTADNPKVPEGDINEAKESLPQDVFSQEYLAEFLEDAAGVFRNVRRCAIGKPQEPVKGRKYYAGIDLARVTDFTVLIIFDEYGNQVYMDRFNILDWQIQRRRLVDALQRYNNALALIDATAMGGDIFLEDMRRDYRWTEGYKFTNESKKQIIELLMISFEKERIKIFADPVLTNELGIFEYKVNPSGTISYNAPDGYHDDAVIALALANWKLYHGPRFIFSLSENDIY